MTRLWLGVFIAIVLLVPARAADEATIAPEDPAFLYFQPADFASPALSPDGKTVAFIARQAGHRRLFKLDRDTRAMGALFDPGEGEVIAFHWMGNQRLLIEGVGRYGYGCYRQDLSPAQTAEVTNLHARHLNQLFFRVGDSGHVVFHNGWTRRILEINVVTDQERQIGQLTHHDSSAVLSPQGELRATGAVDWDHWQIAWRRPDDKWERREGDGGDVPFFPWAVDADDRHLLVVASDQGGTRVLMRLDPATGERTLVASRPGRDVADLLYLPPSPVPVGVRFTRKDADDTEFFDPALQALYATLRKSLPDGIVRIVSTSSDRQVMIVSVRQTLGPNTFYFLDRTTGKLASLSPERPTLTHGGLGQPRFFHFRTRDGHDAAGLVLLPSAPTGDRLPRAIVQPLAHVGSWPVYEEEFAAGDQYLASRGFATVYVFTRGTRGFGRAWLEAGNFELDGHVIDDLEDGLHWLAQEKLIDAGHIFVAGKWDDGLMALFTASASPLFHGAIAFNPFSSVSLGQMQEKSTDDIIAAMGGHNNAYAKLRPFDPEVFIPRLKAPVLIIESTSFGGEHLGLVAGIIRDQLRKHHKAYEWKHLDFAKANREQTEYFESIYYKMIADYLSAQP